MKNILTLFIALTLVYSCSKNDDTNTNKPELTTNLPTALSFSPTTAKIGDTIKISGKGFEKDKTYTITFTENIKANSIETTSSYLKVIVPEGAVSGKIIFETKTIDSITITATNAVKLYAFKGSDELNTTVIPEIININPNNGKETIIKKFKAGEYIQNLVFNNNTDEIYGIGENNKLIKTNVINKTTATITLDTSSEINYELVIDNKNNLYAFKGNDEPNTTIVPKIISINPNDGKETVIKAFQTSVYIRNLVFNNSTNEIYGIDDNNKLYIININGTSKTIALDNTSDIDYELIIDAKNNLYAFKGYDDPNPTIIPAIISINPVGGKETIIKKFDINKYLRGLVFNNETNQFYGIGDNNTLYIVGLDGITKTIELDKSNNINYELVTNTPL